VRRAAARRIARAGCALLAVALIVVMPRSPAGQPDTRIPWVGYLANEPTPDSAPVLREGLRERNWVDGQSIKIWYRYVQGKPELYQQHADDLVRLNVAVIVAFGSQAISGYDVPRWLRRRVRTMPSAVGTLPGNVNPWYARTRRAGRVAACWRHCLIIEEPMY